MNCHFQDGDIISQFDSLSQRWFVVGNTDIPTSTPTIQPRLFLGVSNSSEITNNTVWTFYTFIVSQIPPAVPSRPFLIADFPHMGIDNEAIYIGYDEFDSADPSYLNCTALVIQKSSVLNDGPAVINAFRDLFINDGTALSTGVNNFVSNPQNGFIIGFNFFTFANLNLYRISNPGSTNPTISPVELLSINPILTTFYAPQLGNLYGANALLETASGSITGAVIQNNQLYTCFDVGVDNTGNSNSLSADREGALWFQFDVSQPTSALVQSGVIFDSSAVNPRFFYWPGIMVNQRGDVAIASSVALLMNL